jgi:SAM-dependent methyltransferase
MISSILPFKFKFIYNDYNKKEFCLLDVGCGNNSATRIKRWLPKCKYYGLDNKVCNNDPADFDLMEKFYNIDLEKDSLNSLPNEHFDVVLIAHVIEHLNNGTEILSEITKKVKQGGKIYIEFPSLRSLSFPGKGLHFCDDPSHVRAYDIKEIVNELLANNFKIIKAGICRSVARILISPVQFFRIMLIQKKITFAGLWDLYGFADYVYAVKK